MLSSRKYPNSYFSPAAVLFLTDKTSGNNLREIQCGNRRRRRCVVRRTFTVRPHTAVFQFSAPTVLRFRLEKWLSKRSVTIRSDPGSGTVLYLDQTRSRCVIRNGMTKSTFLATRCGRGMAGKRKSIVLYVWISPKMRKESRVWTLVLRL